MMDIRTGLALGAERLTAAGIPNARAEARLLLGHAAGLTLETMIGYPERPIEDETAYLHLVARRVAREPLSHLTGRREFWSMEFTVTPDTLDPRPDTEALVEAVLARTPDKTVALKILDLGTGTGCVLAALLSQLPGAFGIAVDRNPATARVAAQNLAASGLAGRSAVIVGDWADSLKGGFNIVVSNPPYIPSGEIDGLEPEVATWEPRLALDGGPDGLDALRMIAADLRRLLRPDGFAALEFGYGQGEAVAVLTMAAGLKVHERCADLAGRERCLVCGPEAAPSDNVKE